jgi:hypothetical protein
MDQRVTEGMVSAWDDIEYVRQNPEYRPAFLTSMVRAGLLEELPGEWPTYRLVAFLSHKHTYYIDSAIRDGSDVCLVGCRTCPSTWYVPNRLPIEVPTREMLIVDA